MKRFGASLFLLLITPAVLFAQQSVTSDWSMVDKLKRGTKIIGTTKSGQEFAGSKRISNDELLFIESELPSQTRQIISLRKDDIREVRETKRHWFYKVTQYRMVGPQASIYSEIESPCGHRKVKTIYGAP